MAARPNKDLRKAPARQPARKFVPGEGDLWTQNPQTAAVPCSWLGMIVVGLAIFGFECGCEARSEFGGRSTRFQTLALENDHVVATLEVNHNVGIGRQIAAATRLGTAVEVERVVDPDRPGRHRVRTRIRSGC